jgi:hypothetical protein
MAMCIAYGDYSLTAASTSCIVNVQFINFTTKFSNFHSVFCTDDGLMRHQ